MNIIERIKLAVKSADYNNENPDNIDKLIGMAYYLGREEATRQICNEHNIRVAEAIKRAGKCRYHNMAFKVLADAGKRIYSPDYTGEMTDTFGMDDTNL